MGSETFDGYFRVTQILDRFKDAGYYDWVMRVGKKEANRIKKEAMAIGSNVDSAIRSEIDKGEVVKLKTSEARSCFAAWTRFKNEFAQYAPSMVTGKRLFCEELKVTGEPDIETEDTIIDIKCSNKIRWEYWLQTEFYARMKNKPFKAILRLDKELGDYEFVRLPVSDECWLALQGAIKLFAYLEKTVTDGKE